MSELKKWVVSTIAGLIATFGKQYVFILVCVMAVVIFDWITGIIAVKATGGTLSSKKANIGFWKKVALFVALGFGFFLDIFIPYALLYINVDFPKNMIFGMIIGCYIVINESISICENLYRSNSNILPKWIVKMFTQAKEQIDKKGDKQE